jgi:hypothetical protein
LEQTVRTFALSLLVCSLLFCSRAEAQLAPYNPYAKSEDEALPVRADGKLTGRRSSRTRRWRIAFRATSKSALRRHESGHQQPAQNNKVDVNGLPETAVVGRRQLTTGIVTIVGRWDARRSSSRIRRA